MMSCRLILVGSWCFVLTNFACAFVPFGTTFPNEITFRASVMTNVLEQAKPLAYFDENYTSTTGEPFPQFRGFQPDLLRALVKVAKVYDNVTLTFELEEAPLYDYSTQFNYMANDCNSTVYSDHPIPKEDCDRLDLVVGDFYPWASRAIRAPFTPVLLNTAAAALQYVYRKKRKVGTLAHAEALQEPVCLLKNSHYDEEVMRQYNETKALICYSHKECVDLLKAEECALFVDDDLQLKHMVKEDPELRMSPDSFGGMDIAWPVHHTMSDLKLNLLFRWIYRAKNKDMVHELYEKYFTVAFCPIGKAGKNCDQPCSPTNGLADRQGLCICDSTKWTGPDCETEVVEELNMIPTALKAMSYIMVGINFLAVAVCALWLLWHRKTPQVIVAQPIFLSLILLGCVISTSTIFALAQEDEGDGPVHACMAIPWLYSVGFCITFGTLLAKIRRVWLLFVAAANMQRIEVSARETFLVIGLVLLGDLVILIVWTIFDPLEWQRTIVSSDKYLHPLESEGHCFSESWLPFATTIALYHLLLMLSASYMCYVSRDLSTRFSEGRFLSIAMVSNVQIFVVGVPILVIIGNDPQTSFFVRSVMIFINDLAVILLIFGNLMWSVHKDHQQQSRHSSRQSLIKNALKSYRRRTLDTSKHSEGGEPKARFNSSTTPDISNTKPTSSNMSRDGMFGAGSDACRSDTCRSSVSQSHMLEPVYETGASALGIDRDANSMSSRASANSDGLENDACPTPIKEVTESGGKSLAGDLDGKGCRGAK